MATVFKPQSLRALLVLLLIIVIAGGAGIFYLGLREVRTFAIEVNHTVANAEASGGDVQKLQALKGQLAQSEALIQKADQMFATTENYQNQAITDIRNYATAAGISVASTSFSSPDAGINPTMTVGLKAPVSYKNLIKFLDGIEGNIPKMQVSSISIDHVAGGNADSVAVKDIKIMIATR